MRNVTPAAPPIPGWKWFLGAVMENGPEPREYYVPAPDWESEEAAFGVEKPTGHIIGELLGTYEVDRPWGSR